MHLDLGELGQDVGGVLELDPVELQVLAGGEVTVAAIPLLGDVSQRVELG